MSSPKMLSPEEMKSSKDLFPTRVETRVMARDGKLIHKKSGTGKDSGSSFVTKKEKKMMLQYLNLIEEAARTTDLARKTDILKHAKQIGGKSY